MTREEFETELDRLGLAPRILAQLVGRDARSIYRYRNGTMPVPDVLARWLRSVEQVETIGLGTLYGSPPPTGARVFINLTPTRKRASSR